ncbi:MAG: proline dehydrogenase family protein [Ferrimicrobium sp.]
MASIPRERAIREIARQLASVDGESGVYQLRGIARLVMRHALTDPIFRADLFRLVDVFPTLETPATITSHAREYLDPRAPRWMATSQRLADRLSIGRRVLAKITRSNIIEMANQFILGTGVDEITKNISSLAQQGYLTTVDLLGEKVLTTAESDRYLQRITEIHKRLAIAGAFLDTNGDLQGPSVSISIKPSALSPHYAPLQRNQAIEEVVNRLTPLAMEAQAAGSLLFLDMEHFDSYELTIEVFNRLSRDPDLQHLNLGIVLQAYLRCHEAKLMELLSALDSVPHLHSEAGTPRLWIRLVKGAYWDTEFAQANSESVDPPVFIDKAETDLSYESSTDILLANADRIHPAFASHNLRSLANVMAIAKEYGRSPADYEMQLLYGMAEPLSSALREAGQSVRIYTPVGELLPGMSYLVRRLLENTSNSSFVRQRFGDHGDVDRLVAPPKLTGGTVIPAAYPVGYRHEPPTQWRDEETIKRQSAAIKGVLTQLATPTEVCTTINDQLRPLKEHTRSINPMRPEWTLANVAESSMDDLDLAVEAAECSRVAWSATPAQQRAEILERAANFLRHNRAEINAVEVLEAGKPWMEADNDLGEAIDFCNYYAYWIRQLDADSRLDSPAGEFNRLRLRGRGTTAVVPPWNFPLAIPTGMVAAALAAGNPVILKPAEQTPLTASYLMRAFAAAGLPRGVLTLLPGGANVGAALVRHPGIATIAFTGSRPVGLDIMRAAMDVLPGQRQLKRVIAEMGGKNAIIVDADADLDQAVPGVLYSAFGFAGQKCSACSRVIVHHSIADAFTDRLIEATKLIVIGDPRDPATQIGPVIDEDAMNKITTMITDGTHTATLAFQGDHPGGDAYIVPPAIFVDVDRNAPLYRDEIFGPVLTVETADNLDDAIWRANDTLYGLTQGIYSRSPKAIAYATSQAHAGNFYINRPITGAVPGRHPFGGFGHSGVGFKAGGSTYLLQFLDQQVVSENLLRQGFSPDIS